MGVRINFSTLNIQFNLCSPTSFSELQCFSFSQCSPDFQILGFISSLLEMEPCWAFQPTSFIFPSIWRKTVALCHWQLAEGQPGDISSLAYQIGYHWNQCTHGESWGHRVQRDTGICPAGLSYWGTVLWLHHFLKTEHLSCFAASSSPWAHCYLCSEAGWSEFKHPGSSDVLEAEKSVISFLKNTQFFINLPLEAPRRAFKGRKRWE
jgi:hypothetical protein